MHADQLDAASELEQLNIKAALANRPRQHFSSLAYAITAAKISPLAISAIAIAVMTMKNGSIRTNSGGWDEQVNSGY